MSTWQSGGAVEFCPLQTAVLACGHCQTRITLAASLVRLGCSLSSPHLLGSTLEEKVHVHGARLAGALLLSMALLLSLCLTMELALTQFHTLIHTLLLTGIPQSRQKATPFLRSGALRASLFPS